MLPLITRAVALSFLALLRWRSGTHCCESGSQDSLSRAQWMVELRSSRVRLCESVPVQPTDHCYSIPNGWFPFQSGMEFTCKSVLVGKRWTRNLSEKPTVCVA